jgi:hypothetical protein
MELEDFLQELRTLLMETTYEWNGLVPGYLGPLLQRAWEEVAPSYEELEVAVRSGEYEHQLVRAGLRGAQFQVKAEGFLHHLTRFRLRRSPRWLRKTLKWADIILGSLASVIPAGDAVKEFKEAIESGAEDMEDGAAHELA